MRVEPDSLSPGRAFMICSCLLSGVKRQTQNLGDSNSSLRFAAYWSHCLRHIIKSVTSASSPENEAIYPFLRLSTDLGGDYWWLDTAWQNRKPGFKSWI